MFFLFFLFLILFLIFTHSHIVLFSHFFNILLLAFNWPQNRETHYDTNGTTMSELRLVPRASDNGKKLHCLVYNSAMSSSAIVWEWSRAVASTAPITMTMGGFANSNSTHGASSPASPLGEREHSLNGSTILSMNSVLASTLNQSQSGGSSDTLVDRRTLSVQCKFLTSLFYCSLSSQLLFIDNSHTLGKTIIATCRINNSLGWCCQYIFQSTKLTISQFVDELFLIFYRFSITDLPNITIEVLRDDRQEESNTSTSSSGSASDDKSRHDSPTSGQMPTHNIVANQFHIIEQKPVQIKCIVDSNPTVYRIRWLHDKREILPGNHKGRNRYFANLFFFLHFLLFVCYLYYCLNARTAMKKSSILATNSSAILSRFFSYQFHISLPFCSLDCLTFFVFSSFVVIVSSLRLMNFYALLFDILSLCAVFCIYYILVSLPYVRSLWIGWRLCVCILCLCVCVCVCVNEYARAGWLYCFRTNWLSDQRPRYWLGEWASESLR